MTTIDLVGAAQFTSVLEQLRSGTQFAVMFGGQGGDCFARLDALIATHGRALGASELWDTAWKRLGPIQDEVVAWHPIDLGTPTWRTNARGATNAAVSVPAVAYTQLLELAALEADGLCLTAVAPTVIAGHSQGLISALVATGALEPSAALALAHIMATSATRVARRYGLTAHGGSSPMLAVRGLQIAELRSALLDSAVGSDVVVAISNGVDRHVLSGPPARLDALVQWFGESSTEVQFDQVDATVAFHHPGLADAVELVAAASARCGIELNPGAGTTPVVGIDGPLSIESLTRAILTDHLDWITALDSIADSFGGSGTGWIVDLSPNTIVANLSATHLAGRGIGICSPIPTQGVSTLITPGAAPELDTPYRDFAPTAVRFPDGTLGVETRLTRAVGQSPFILAGMTPTTVDAAIVAAAANAGHWAELAGGGQVTAEILAERMVELSELLDDGVGVHFNTLHLDPYLWNLHLGGEAALLTELRKGAPVRGVTISAGIPELDDAVALIDQLRELGVDTVTFKPGTIAGIRSVIEIAQRVDPITIVAHIEGGLAGGHHSWEDLDSLLVTTYASLRRCDNLIVCVGGGIGTPEAARQYLDGSWAHRHGRPSMPLDGVLIGTAAMACAEATTSPQVKALLAQAAGRKGWIEAGTALDGVASGRSQLGADIHELDNAASAAGRLLDAVAGDTDAVQARRDEIIAAIDATAKPYFGDLDTMTYGSMLDRFVQLCAIGRDGRYEDGAWLDRSWRTRFVDLFERTHARLSDAETGEIDSLLSGPADVDDPRAAIAALGTAVADLHTTVLHPIDVAFFAEVCARPGKPVPFVPVIDAQVRRWWRSDSLWQAHDDRYDADGVVIIPGPAALSGIETVDEPIGALLGRFEAHVAESLAAISAPRPVLSRRDGDIVERVLSDTQLHWAHRHRPNPFARSDAAHRWTLLGDGSRRHGPTGSTITALNDSTAVVEVPLRVNGSLHSTAVVHIGLGDGPADGLVVTASAVSELSRSLRAAATGSADQAASIGFDLNTALDHAALFDSPTILGDHLVGRCWPAVFAALDEVVGDAVDTREATEGFVSLVHLDHRIDIAPIDLDELGDGELAVSVHRHPERHSTAGRVIAVTVEISDAHDDSPIATLNERFLVRDGSGPEPLDATVGYATGDDTVRTERKTLATDRVVAPPHSAAMEAFTGDHNPLHNNEVVAALAGFDEPIVHGMWVSAAMQRCAQAATAHHSAATPRRLNNWSVQFLTPLRYGSAVDLSVVRVGRRHGSDVIEVHATCDGAPVASATGVLEAPLTAYGFPGQGIQRVAMGLDALGRSGAAREVWDRADRHTRDVLGFSILKVVRDNPTEIQVGADRYVHPDGVLHLTQFTQVAMATLAAAQVAELREAGGLVDASITCGHSVGEYNALAAITGILSLEDVVEVVYHRGLSMHRLVPRDATGASRYRMAAVRPVEAGLSEDELAVLVADISEELHCNGSDPDAEFIQIVNYNLRGRQYAIAGTNAALHRLSEEMESRRAARGGKGVFILVPGIDVPFHSEVLRDGVDEFRQRLDHILPPEIDPALLVGRYIPNLVPRLFSLERAFVTEIAQTVPSALLGNVLERWSEFETQPAVLCRAVLLELLSWQFASPVRWIETQDLLFKRRDSGGLGVDRFVEIGLGTQPTIESLARQTVTGVSASLGTDLTMGRPHIMGIETARAELFGEDTDDVDATDDVDESAEVAAADVPTTDRAGADQLSSPSAPAHPFAHLVANVGTPTPDITWSAPDGLRLLLSWWTRIRGDQLGASDTIDNLTDGASSRRNQLLMDLGKEFNLSAIDGAAQASLDTLTDEVRTRARTYRAPGPVLAATIDEQLRRVCGPAKARPSAIAERVESYWGLGGGWATVVAAELAATTRAGTSVRGGDLASATECEPTNLAALHDLVDATVQRVAASRSVAVAPLATATSTSLDEASVAELLDTITGPDGVLTKVGRLLSPPTATATNDGADDEANAEHERLASIVESELGANWAELVAPRFDERQTLVIDDRWAGQREDLFALVNTAPHNIAERDRLTARLMGGLADGAAAQARVHLNDARDRLDDDLTQRLAAIEAAHNTADAPQHVDTVALVTGASPDSIAASVVAELLAGGATVIATSSSLTGDRVRWYRELYHAAAHHRAALWLAPANMASFRDVDQLLLWLASDVSVHEPAEPPRAKAPLTPTVLFPFAAPPVRGELGDVDGGTEVEMRVLLWSVEAMIAGLAQRHAEQMTTARVVLPGSPNRGIFGGDGPYGEAKAAFDALVERSHHESWGTHVSIVHPSIGWVRGTGLMAANDALVERVEAAGITTWSPTEIATRLVELSVDIDTVGAVDLSGGLATVQLDLAELARGAQREAQESGADAEPSAGDSDEARPRQIAALPCPPSHAERSELDWPELDIDPCDTVVIVGFGEVGPLGSTRTRFEVEVDNELSVGAVAELAWLCGLIRWEHDPTPGFYDTESGERVLETDLVERYEQRLREHSGIRVLSDDATMQQGTVPLLCSVYLDQDLSFVVADAAEAAAFVAADPERTSMAMNADGSVTVTRQAGTEIRVPRRVELPRQVGAQLPDGFDPTVYGISADMVESIDRVAIWNLVATVDAFVDAGISPAELLRWVHPTEVANTQGTGIGGISAIRSMYVDSLLGTERPNDILQEGLPNVIAAHVMQSYVGGYGAMVHPVAACATAAVSVEEAYDKIRTGRAKVVVAGGFDDYGPEGLLGFAAMNATASSEAMAAAGIAAGAMSRPNDRRRAGFVEGQGGGTVVLARGDVAAQLGLPVRAVVAWAGSFSDGVHTSIPAPGLGLIGAGRGGTSSTLAQRLADFGITGDDISVISKHDTSTNANDPNESLVHERLATALSRNPHRPLPVISQKSVTGHAKGGAAAFQLNGMCQVLESSTIPPNRSLDCVDPDFARFERLVWPTTPIRSQTPLRAGLITSLGFGHVSALVALVHPDAFVATLEATERDRYRAAASLRRVSGQYQRLRAQAGGEALYQRPKSPYGTGEDRSIAEQAMLVTPAEVAR